MISLGKTFTLTLHLNETMLTLSIDFFVHNLHDSTFVDYDVWKTIICVSTVLIITALMRHQVVRREKRQQQALECIEEQLGDH
jgi:hypothetical protein